MEEEYLNLPGKEKGEWVTGKILDGLACDARAVLKVT